MTTPAQREVLELAVRHAVLNLLEHMQSSGFGLSLDDDPKHGFWVVVGRVDSLPLLIPGQSDPTVFDERAQ